MRNMSDATVTEALSRLAPSAGTAEEAYAAAFRDVADLLLDRTTLRVAGHPHRFTELELYWSGLAHVDPFTHGDPIQRRLGAWYFHRSGGRYRGGTYKGLDLAFGSHEAFGGILIRGLERVDAARSSPSAALIDGPCMVVDHILALTASPSIEALVSRFDATIESRDRRSPLHVELDAGPGRGQPVHATPRIGLTLKKGATEARRRYLARPYRFLTEPARIRKGKPHLITALHQQGRSPAEIAALTGTRRAVVEGYLAAFEAGKARPIAEFGGDVSTTDELCQLLGACAAIELT
jgi:hypothetical protein